MPTKMTVTATVPEKKMKDGSIRKQIGPYTITVQAGETGDESIKMFGQEAVNSNANSNWTVTLQSNMRSGMIKGESQEALQARLGSAKMGVAVRGVKVDPIEAYMAEFANATPEKQAKMLADLKARASQK